MLSRRTKLYANLAGIEVGDGFPVRVVGAINVSPESFYSGSVAHGGRALERRALQMVQDGAAVLDVGAMSTAPYVKGAISEAEERRRMTAAVRLLRATVPLPISVDTQRASVASAGLEAGAAILNDVSGLRDDPQMGAVARAAGGVILTAAEQRPSRAPPLQMIAALLRQCLQRAQHARIARTRIILDPGIGFFRRAALPWDELDCLVLSRLARLRNLGHPLLVGVSRKSFIGKLTRRSDTAERLAGSLAATAIAVYNGAHLIRTHDVAATIDAVRIAEGVRNVRERSG